MDHLDEISVEELQDALDNVEGNKPTQRLLAAIAYKNGVTQSELAEWHDTGRRTIYSWLKRLDTDEPLEQAVTDAHRSGRKRKLSEQQQDSENSQNNSKTISNEPCTIHPRKPGSTRRRGRRRSSSNIWKRPTTSNIQSRVAGGC